MRVASRPGAGDLFFLPARPQLATLLISLDQIQRTGAGHRDADIEICRCADGGSVRWTSAKSDVLGKVADQKESGEMKVGWIGVVLIASAALADVALADGMFISDIHRHLEEPSQKAVVVWDGHKETLVLSAAVKSDDLASFSWIVPIVSRSPPIVSAGDIVVFRRLVSYFAQERPHGMLPAPKHSAKGVEVVESKEVDVYDVTVLRATDVRELMSWFSANGYQVPERAEAVFGHYLEAGDVFFVANKIDLRNRYEPAIEETEQRFEDLQRRHDRLCADVKTGLSGLGITLGPQGDESRRRCYEEALSSIRHAILDAANPLHMPRKWDVQLKSGLRIEEVCDIGSTPRFEDGQINLTPRSGRLWTMVVYRNGEVVGAIGEIGSAHQDRRVRSTWRFRESGKLTQPESLELQKYIDRRRGYHAFTQDQDAACRRRLDELGVSLSAALLPSLQELSEQNPILGRGGRAVDLVSRVRVVYQSSDQSVRARLRPLREVISALRSGLATPLKFEFEPPAATYPLRLSSLNMGSTRIEVYVLGKAFVKDRSGLLRTDRRIVLSGERQKSIAEYLPVGNARYATRLIFSGPLADLTADAVFAKDAAEGRPGQGNGLGPPESQLELKHQLAGDPLAPEVILRSLAKDEDFGIRFRVAGNPACPVDALRWLAGDSERGVRRKVARNPSAPPDVLTVLAADEDEDVRFEVAFNASSPGALLRDLATSTNAKMRATVAGNAAAPDELLKQLLEDSSLSVVTSARAALAERMKPRSPSAESEP